MEQKRLKPWHGIVTFVVMMVIFIIVAIPVQGGLGLIGVGITELLLLAMAIGAALVFKQKLKEVFPIRLPKVREILGVLVFWIGSFVLTTMASAALAILFPQDMAAVSDGLNSVVTSEGMVLGIVIVSILPAICEEAVHRGFILHTFKGIKKQWLVVLSMALIFGAFHLDPYRFVPTAILGGCMTWVMLKTDNMLMPSLFHATNNLVPVLLSFAMQSLTETVVTADGPSATMVVTMTESKGVFAISTIGSYLMFAAIALPLMLAGTALMKKKGEKLKKRHTVTVFILAGVMLVAGITMVIGASVYLVLVQGIGM